MKECNMCGQFFETLVERKNGDEFCLKCHEENCEHLNTETIPVGNGWETITVCHDCDMEL